MIDKQQPEALELASVAESADLVGYPTAKKANAYYLCLLEDCAQMIRRLHAENETLRAELETLRAKLKTYEDLGDAGSDVQILRTGYAAARLEIESLNAQLHAAKQINAAQFGLLAASIPGSAMRASHGQAPAQPAPQQEAQEPVAWQSRTRPTWGGNDRPWSPWEPCTKGQAEDCWKTPLLHEWAYEARALYTAPQPSPAAQGDENA